MGGHHDGAGLKAFRVQRLGGGVQSTPSDFPPDSLPPLSLDRRGGGGFVPLLFLFKGIFGFFVVVWLALHSISHRPVL